MKIAVLGCAMVTTGALVVMWPELKGLHVNARMSKKFRAAGFGLLCIGIAALVIPF